MKAYIFLISALFLTDIGLRKVVSITPAADLNWRSNIGANEQAFATSAQSDTYLA
jgi:hypothetical protein